MRLILILSLFFLIISPPAHAKKSKNKKGEKQKTEEVAGRFNLLTDEDKRKFDSLSDEQREKIMQGKIDQGFNAWMVKIALGEPFYGTEHHPEFVDYEEVWLYTKKDITRDVTENKIFDTQTNWPTVHRITKTKTCNISDFFLLWDRGVVQAVHKETSPQVHGSCTIETEEAFLPIVDGKPVEPKQP